MGPQEQGKHFLPKQLQEAHVPFFSMSGSDFVEMFVGVGASRVETCFTKPKKKSSVYHFIDEIECHW